MINLMGIQKLYMGLAWVAALVLIVPLFTLGASAARLSARRRDERLASLRLIGASTTLIVGLSVADALVYSLVGFIIGLLLYLVLIFPFGALHFMNVPLGAENMLLPVSVIFYCFLGCMVLAALSQKPPWFGLAKVASAAGCAYPREGWFRRLHCSGYRCCSGHCRDDSGFDLEGF